MSEFEMGLWFAFTEKNNAIEVQRCVVPWLISLEGMKHSKSIKLDMIKEMLLALSPTLDFVRFDVEEAKVENKVGFAEIAKRVKAAAGIMIIYRVYTLIYFSLFIPALTTFRGPQNGRWQGTGPTCGKSSLTSSSDPSQNPILWVERS